MSPQSQRVAIAEACGAKWNLFASGYAFLTMVPLVGEEWRLLDGPGEHKQVIGENIPDYLTDLNACHEMEKVLFKDEILWRDYRDFCYKFYLANDTFSLSAAQKSQCFLRTVGKWVEESK